MADCWAKFPGTGRSPLVTSNHAKPEGQLQFQCNLHISTASLVLFVKTQDLKDSSQLPQLEEQLQFRSANGWGDLVAAIRQILAGERSEDEVCWELDRIDSLIVGEVLRKLRS